MHGEHYGPVGFQFGRDLLKIAAMQQKRVLGNCIRALTPSGVLRNVHLLGLDQVATAFIGLPLSEIDLALIGNPDLGELAADVSTPSLHTLCSSEWLSAHPEYEDLTVLTIDAYGDDFEGMQVVFLVGRLHCVSTFCIIKNCLNKMSLILSRSEMVGVVQSIT
jgi:hypothetical protein